MIGLVCACWLRRDDLEQRLQPTNRLRDQGVFRIGNDREPCSVSMFMRASLLA